MPKNLSVCLIVKNEEMYLSRALASVTAVADEIIVVDTGSTDDTVAIARRFTGAVYSYRWRDDFAAARNFALDLAEGDWILSLDGDEELDRISSRYLPEAISAEGVAAYLLAIENSDRKDVPLAFPELQPRLFRNRGRLRYQGKIPERLCLDQSDRVAAAPWLVLRHHRGDKLDNLGRLGRGLAMINRVLTGDNDQAAKRWACGRLLMNCGFYEEALAEFQILLQEVGDDGGTEPQAYRQLVNCLQLAGRRREALELIEKSINTSPQSGEFHYLKGAMLLEEGDYSGAYSSLKQALPLLEGYAQSAAHHLLGGLAEYYLDREEALGYYLQAIRVNPRTLTPLARIIAILDPVNNPGDTLESLHLAFDLSDPGIQLEVASLLYRERAYQPALQMIAALEQSGGLTDRAVLLKGCCLLHQGNYEAADTELKKIGKDQSSYPQAHYYLALGSWLCGDPERTAEILSAISDAASEPGLAAVLSLLSEENWTAGKPQRKEEILLAEEIIDIIVETGGNKETIREAYRRLAPLLGERPSWRLGESLYLHGDYRSAIREWKALLFGGRDYPLLHYYLGQCYHALGDLETAYRHLHQALADGLDTPRIRREAAIIHQKIANRLLNNG